MYVGKENDLCEKKDQLQGNKGSVWESMNDDNDADVCCCEDERTLPTDSS